MGRLDDVAEQERGDGLAAHARVVGGGERLREHAVVLGRIPLLVGGNGVRDDDALAMAERVQAGAVGWSAYDRARGDTRADGEAQMRAFWRHWAKAVAS